MGFPEAHFTGDSIGISKLLTKSYSVRSSRRETTLQQTVRTASISMKPIGYQPVPCLPTRLPTKDGRLRAGAFALANQVAPYTTPIEGVQPLRFDVECLA
jgi:hypothetical protein